MGAALGEENLSVLEGAGEGCPVRDIAPTANVQVLGFDVLESHKAVNACGGRVRGVGGDEGDDVGEFDGFVLGHGLGVFLFESFFFCLGLDFS